MESGPLFLVFFPDEYDKNAGCKSEANEDCVFFEFSSVAFHGCCSAPGGCPEDLVGLGIEDYGFDVHAVFHARHFVSLDLACEDGVWLW